MRIASHPPQNSISPHASSLTTLLPPLSSPHLPSPLLPQIYFVPSLYLGHCLAWVKFESSSLVWIEWEFDVFVVVVWRYLFCEDGCSGITRLAEMGMIALASCILVGCAWWRCAWIVFWVAMKQSGYEGFCFPDWLGLILGANVVCCICFGCKLVVKETSETWALL